MLSGIGPRDMLEYYDIPVYADLPVGKHLKNHVGATIPFIFTKVENKRTLDWNALMRYILNKEGPMTSTGLTQVRMLFVRIFSF